MKYKVGDKVRIKSLDWYNANRNDDWGSIELPNGNFYPSMAKYCGEVLTIIGIHKNGIYITKEGESFNWTDEMIEGLVEEKVDLIPKFGEYSDNEPLDIPTMTTDFVKEHGLPCPDGYEFRDENGNVINATKIVLEKKKKEYPKTYEECCSVLGYSGNYNMILTTDVDNKLFNALYKLKVCRDAYWKIAGEEMGLGKPWEPDYTEKTIKYCLRTNYCRIVQTRTSHDNHPFSFPTEEMRDAFKENFDPDIEICKELL